MRTRHHENFSTLGNVCEVLWCGCDDVQFCGGISSLLQGISSVHWRVLSTVGGKPKALGVYQQCPVFAAYLNSTKYPPHYRIPSIVIYRHSQGWLLSSQLLLHTARNCLASSGLVVKRMAILDFVNGSTYLLTGPTLLPGCGITDEKDILSKVYWLVWIFAYLHSLRTVSIFHSNEFSL